MVMPPKKPLLLDGVEMDYFDRLIEDVAPIFKLYNVELDFAGYDELKDLYESCDPEDSHTLWHLAKAFNTWEDYFIECLSVTQKLLLDAETTKKEVQANKSIELDPVKVANGDRLADRSEELVAMRKNRNAFQSVYDLLKNKQKSAQNGYYLCKKAYELRTQMELYRVDQPKKQSQNQGMVHPPKQQAQPQITYQVQPGIAGPVAGVPYPTQGGGYRG